MKWIRLDEITLDVHKFIAFRVSGRLICPPRVKNITEQWVLHGITKNGAWCDLATFKTSEEAVAQFEVLMHKMA